MVNNRRGAGTLGCLFSIFIVVALGYFVTHFGEAFLRSYRFQDAMSGELRQAGRKGNDEIRARLQLVADSLGIPEEGRAVTIARAGPNVAIWSEYSEPIELPFGVKNIRFTPHALGRALGDSASSRR